MEAEIQQFFLGKIGLEDLNVQINGTFWFPADRNYGNLILGHLLVCEWKCILFLASETLRKVFLGEFSPHKYTDNTVQRKQIHFLITDSLFLAWCLNMKCSFYTHEDQGQCSKHGGKQSSHHSTSPLVAEPMTEAIYFRVSDYVRRITYHLFK
jgi:hypothetical protein